MFDMCQVVVWDFFRLFLGGGGWQVGMHWVGLGPEILMTTGAECFTQQALQQCYKLVIGAP